jgi:hypothetical protein
MELEELDSVIAHLAETPEGSLEVAVALLADGVELEADASHA